MHPLHFSMRRSTTPFPAALASWCHAVSEATARLLLARAYIGDSDDFDCVSEVTVQKVLDLASQREDGMGHLLTPPYPASTEETNELEHRLARLVLVEWNRLHTSDPTSPHPDVLALTLQFLTSPESPHTYYVSRYCLILTLRSLYEISLDFSSIQSLRQAYDRLRGRIAAKSTSASEAGDRFEELILDICHLEGWLHRLLSKAKAERYYRSFLSSPLGVTSGLRKRVSNVFAPAIPDREIPEFGAILSVLFAHPTAVSGLDLITGGILPAVPASENGPRGALVNLLAGPPGSGKTSLCLLIASRMAELGSVVRYVTTEEDEETLRSKLTALANPLSVLFAKFLGAVPHLAEPDFDIVDGSRLYDLASVSENLKRTFEAAQVALKDYEHVSGTEVVHSGVILQLPLAFPRVLIIDSITALLQIQTREADSGPRFGMNDQPPRNPRRQIGSILRELRQMGVCIFLVGGEEDQRDSGLSYLVDNVFTLAMQPAPETNHPIRLLQLEKTRLQRSDSGPHILHLSGQDGPTLSPSLHSVLRRVTQSPSFPSDPQRRAAVWGRLSEEQLSLDLDEPPNTFSEESFLTIRARSQSLVYGHGASGKARFALALAFEPRVRVNPTSTFGAYLLNRSRLRPEHHSADLAHLNETRILIVSFLFTREYYEGLASRILEERFGVSGVHAARHVDVLDFYPGFLDAESVVARIRMRLRQGELSGHPYSSVILDGVHNLVVQFPLLMNAPLLWPTLYRVFRARGIDSVTTFTFFRMVQFGRIGFQQPESITDIQRYFETENGREATDASVDASERLFFHLLASSCDYSFLMEPPVDPTSVRLRNLVRIKLVGSVDRLTKAPLDIIWDPERFRQRVKI